MKKKEIVKKIVKPKNEAPDNVRDETVEPIVPVPTAKFLNESQLWKACLIA